MVTLFAAVTLGILFSIFATQNTGPINLNFGSYIMTNIPAYIVVLIPLLVGIILAFFFHMTMDLSRSLTINEQKDEIKHLKKDLAEITKSEHKLRLENTKIKSDNGEPVDEDSI